MFTKNNPFCCKNLWLILIVGLTSPALCTKITFDSEETLTKRLQVIDPNFAKRTNILKKISGKTIRNHIVTDKIERAFNKKGMQSLGGPKERIAYRNQLINVLHLDENVVICMQQAMQERDQSREEELLLEGKRKKEAETQIPRIKAKTKTFPALMQLCQNLHKSSFSMHEMNFLVQLASRTFTYDTLFHMIEETAFHFIQQKNAENSKISINLKSQALEFYHVLFNLTFSRSQKYPIIRYWAATLGETRLIQRLAPDDQDHQNILSDDDSATSTDIVSDMDDNVDDDVLDDKDPFDDNAENNCDTLENYLPPISKGNSAKKISPFLSP